MPVDTRKVFIAALALLALNTVPGPTDAKVVHSVKSATARARSSVTGTYVGGSPEMPDRLRVSQLKNGNIWFFLNVYYPYHDQSGELSCSMGSAEGNIPLNNNIAVWRCPDGTGSLKFKFSAQGCSIEQSGSDTDVGFGHNVNATGNYKKIASRVIPLKNR